MTRSETGFKYYFQSGFDGAVRCAVRSINRLVIGARFFSTWLITLLLRVINININTIDHAKHSASHATIRYTPMLTWRQPCPIAAGRFV